MYGEVFFRRRLAQMLLNTISILQMHCQCAVYTYFLIFKDLQAVLEI